MLVAVWLVALTVHAGNPRAAGDVIGRDLLYSGLGSYGHLGIYTGSKVLECLNEARPIQQNTLRSFKQASRFWGARYLASKKDFRKVVAKGWAQRNFRPSFTLSPVYTEGRYINKRVWNAATGRWEKRSVMVRAKFRCDSFVVYAFEKGIGYRFPQGELTPAFIFRSCPKARR